MTAQEIFDKVCTHLLTQNARSYGQKSFRSVSACLYRGPNGLQCAVGCLIPDELYTMDMEDKDVYELLAAFGELEPLFGEHKRLLQDLQDIHDVGVAPEVVARWPVRLWQAATEHSLTCPPILTAALERYYANKE